MFKNMRLHPKITFAFVTTVIITAMIIIIIANISTNFIFKDFVVQYRTVRLEQWADIFTVHYIQKGGWEGIEDIFEEPGHRRGRGGRLLPGDQIMLADDGGRVILDTRDPVSDNRMLSKTALAGGFPIQVAGIRVGTLFLNPAAPQGTLSLEEEFSRSVTGAILGGGVIAVGLAAVISLFFTRKIVSPLYRLNAGVKEFARGNYKTRVIVDSQDEIGKLGEAFNFMADSVEKSEELKRNMTADVAHELRTPLSILRGNLESLQAGVIEPDPQVISSLHDEIIRISMLVNDLQDISLAEAGKLNLNLLKTDVEDLFNKVFQTFQYEIFLKRIKFEKNVFQEHLILKIDRDKIMQVLINLLGNALRYTPKGGKIVLGAEIKGAHVVINVSDSGPGINSEDLPYIFERFYRSRKEYPKKDGGSGLGLAIARSFIEAHGGYIWVKNNTQRGSTFSFSLPYTASQSSE
ncbi:sensor histidine kinase [Candidatus Contubernalis alkaliaceticus]|uniref:sensor histidine kinase n=1 Tax=Candidatus Contubernalis alkaliaceticus TaxID=338645 RepID=UPI001F4BD299|nr:ATP-binding protein [Candidatus Contubernalis alkalaceticus]UNC92672.1 HAMP domain-containing protein [Candidatus Contubernalis alkalaceticus]